MLRLQLETCFVWWTSSPLVGVHATGPMARRRRFSSPASFVFQSTTVLFLFVACLTVCLSLSASCLSVCPPSLLHTPHPLVFLSLSFMQVLRRNQGRIWGGGRGGGFLDSGNPPPLPYACTFSKRNKAKKQPPGPPAETPPPPPYD